MFKDEKTWLDLIENNQMFSEKVRSLGIKGAPISMISKVLASLKEDEIEQWSLASIDSAVNNISNNISASEKRLATVENKFNEMIQKMESFTSKIESIIETLGEIEDPYFKDALRTYIGMINISMQKGVSPDEAANSVSYIMYALLGGQAKRVYERDE